MNLTNETVALNVSIKADFTIYLIPCILIVLGMVAFITSSLIVIIILKYPSLRKKEDATHMIGFLAVCDGTTGIGAVTVHLNWFRVYLLNVTSFTRAVCLIPFVPFVYGQFLSQVMIICIAVDRLKAIENPLKYLKEDHSKFAKKSFFITAVLGMFHASSMFHYDLGGQPPEYHITACVHEYWLGYYGLFSITVSLTVLLLYAVMLIALRKKTNTSIGSIGIIEHRAIVSSELKVQARVTRTVTIIIGIFCTLWVFPTLVFAFANIVGMSEQTIALLSHFVAGGSTVSAGSNIFVYAYKIPSFKLYLKKIFKGQKDNGVHPTINTQQNKTYNRRWHYTENNIPQNVFSGIVKKSSRFTGEHIQLQNIGSKRSHLETLDRRGTAISTAIFTL